MMNINRELSWLSFNDRVLQEAGDRNVPAIERLRFLGIFSNNLDEFFRVRVATQRRLSLLSKKQQSLLLFDPQETLNQIQYIVMKHHKKFGKIYREIVNLLEKENIHIVNERKLDERQGEFVTNYFREVVRPSLVPIILTRNVNFPELKDNRLYFAVELFYSKATNQEGISLLEIPNNINRFLVLPQRENKKFVMLVDDVIRYNLREIYSIFNPSSLKAYNFKITRDAELDLDDDISQSWMDKMSASLQRRKKGDPVRFVYDKEMPENLLAFLKKSLKLSTSENIIRSGRYHNFKDFINFPDIGAKNLRYRKLTPVEHPYFVEKDRIMDVVRKRDVLLNYPYQSFNYIIDLLREAAIDTTVKEIKINLYRVASKSRIINALINAVRNGKQVTVILELQARFDEKNNIIWSNTLQESGVKVIFGVPGLKVHSKLILISQKRGNKMLHYAHIGTGNFHEGTATVYTDCALLTCDERITKEVVKVFQFFDTNYYRRIYRHLIVSPFNVRRRFSSLVNQEAINARENKPAKIILKLNNLVDEQLIKRLYDASQAGVEIILIIRGICSLMPGIKGLSDNIKVISIVDRFLEHARILYFHSNGEELYFISSADWMIRNIDKRVEVTTPIYDPKLKTVLKSLLEFQISDNVKARKIDVGASNKYASSDKKTKFQSQLETYKFFKQQCSE